MFTAMLKQRKLTLEELRAELGLSRSTVNQLLLISRCFIRIETEPVERTGRRGRPKVRYWIPLVQGKVQEL